jgi:hypothetical protein
MPCREQPNRVATRFDGAWMRQHIAIFGQRWYDH